jgi:hypothetical protein
MDPVAIAEAAKLITPEDATYLSKRSAELGIPANLHGADVSEVKRIWESGAHTDEFRRAFPTPEAVSWARDAYNASKVQKNLGQIVGLREAAKKLDLPDAAGLHNIAWAQIKHSAKAAGMGLAMIPAAVASGGVALGNLTRDSGDELELPILWLAKQADDELDAFNQEAYDIRQRHYATGGNTFQAVVGSVMGSLPESLASGVGAGLLAKSGVALATGTFVRGAALPAITGARQAMALRAAVIISGAQEGTTGVVQRMKENETEGNDLLRPQDIAYGLAVAATVIGSELLGGARGEFASLGGSAAIKSMRRELGKDLAIQVGQEGFQEGAQQILDDVTKNQVPLWSEVGWATLGGMMAGGAFTLPSVGHYASLVQTEKKVKALEGMQALLPNMANAPSVVTNANGIANMVTVLNQGSLPERLADNELIQLMHTEGRVQASNQSFTMADWSALAQMLGKDEAALAASWGAKREAGMVSIDTATLIVHARKLKPAEFEMVVDSVRSAPDKQSLKDLSDTAKQYEEIAKKISDEYNSPKLPDGTDDDSDLLVDELAGQIQFAAEGAKAKITQSQARASAKIQAAMARTAAISFNAAATKSGGSKITPKQLWEKYGAKFGTTEHNLDKRADYDAAKAVVLLKSVSDVTSVNHELMHHWLEMHRLWVSDANAPAEIKQIVADIGSWADANAKKLSGGNAATEAQIRLYASDMTKLDLTQPGGVAIHEALATQYEQYLKSGKPPTNALRNAFASMRKWFQKIYGSLIGQVDPELEKVFVKMIVSEGEAKRLSLELDPRALGISEDRALWIENTFQKELSEAATLARVKYEAREKAANSAERKREVKAEMEYLNNQDPVWKASAALLTGNAADKLDESAVMAFLKQSGKLHMAGSLQRFMAKGGGRSDISVLAVGLNYPDADAMLTSLAANSMTLEEKAEQNVDTKHATDGETPESQIADAELRALIAQEQSVALRRVIRLGKQADKSEAKAAVTSERMDAIKAEWKKKRDDLASRYKLQNEGWDTDRQVMLREMSQDQEKSIADAAAYRLAEGEKPSPDKMAELGLKIAKLGSSGDFAGAIDAYMKLQVYAEMQNQLKTDTIEAVRTKAVLEMQVLNQVMYERVSKMPAKDIRPHRAMQLASAARKRREIAIAKQDIASIELESRNIAAAEAFHAALEQMVIQRKESLTIIENGTSPANLTNMSTSGKPKVIDNKGVTTYFDSYKEAEMYYDSIGGERNAAVFDTSRDLWNLGTAIRELITSTKITDRRNARLKLQEMVVGNIEGGSSMSWEFRKLVETKGLDPSSWTVADWDTVRRQVEWLNHEAKTRPELMAFIAEAAADMASVKRLIDHSPHKQRDDMNSVEEVAWTLSESNANLRTLLRHFDDGGKNLGDRYIMRPLLDAQVAEQGIRKHVLRITEPAFAAFTAAERKALDTKYTVEGIKTDGMERLVRLSLWGTQSGRQRVQQDLAVRFADLGIKDAKVIKAKTAAFLDNMLRPGSISAKEADLVDAMWQANEVLWKYTDSAANRTGTPHAKKLPNYEYRIQMADGSIRIMSGGYAAVPYIGTSFAIDLLAGDSVNKQALLDLGFTEERMDSVSGKMLDLGIDAQGNSMWARAHTAAYLPVVKTVGGLIYNNQFQSAARTHLGQDYLNDLQEKITTVINGVKPPPTWIAIPFKAMGTAVFAANITTAVKQPLGIISSAGHPEISTLALMAAYAKFLSNPREVSRYAANASGIMENRREAFDIDTAPDAEKIGRTKLTDKYIHSLSWPIRMAQYFGADIITWTAAHDSTLAKQLAMGVPMDKARYEARKTADRILHETQGSAMIAEQAKVNDTAWGKLFTFAGKWVINNANLMYRLTADLKREPTFENASKLAKASLFSVILSSGAMVAASALLQPEKDDEEERDLSDYAIRTALDVSTQPMWILRSVLPMVYEEMWGVPAIATRATGNLATSLYDPPSKLVKQIKKWSVDDSAFSIERTIGAAVGTGALVIPGIPAVQFNRLMEAIEASPEAGWEAFVAAVFGWDKTIRRD